MTISFLSPTKADILALTTLGVNVKEASSPIGYFGTGFKYAIAILLRTGHKIDLHIGEEEYSFIAKETLIRGTPFQVIHLVKPDLSSQSLNFTTELGKNWTPLNAYRELHSNTLDEKGQIVPYGTHPSPTFPTSIVVSGPLIDNCYAKRNEIFLPTLPIITFPNFLEIHPFPSKTYYYRGIAVGQWDCEATHTYNILSNQKLTEDRTLDEFYARNCIGRAVAVLDLDGEDDSPIIQSYLTSILTTTDSMEGSRINWEFHDYKDTSLLLTTANALHKRGVKLSRSIISALHKSKHGIIPPHRPPNDNELYQISLALDLLKKLNFTISYPIKISEHLPNNHHAVVVKSCNEIFLSPIVFNHHRGVSYLAEVLLEEYLHLSEGFQDESRLLQNHLFHLIFKTAEHLAPELFQHPTAR